MPLLPPLEIPEGWTGIAVLFFALAIGHALCDFALQGDFLARAKSRKAELSNLFKGTPPKGVWLHALTAHSLIHAGAVWLITGSPVIAALEFILHWIIDLLKGEEKISFHTDQLLHYGCKILYILLFYV